jgi:hypothetical protein
MEDHNIDDKIKNKNKKIKLFEVPDLMQDKTKT